MMEIITRESAVADGLSTYFTGAPCSKGHIAPRRVINRACSQCSKDDAKARYDARYSEKGAYVAGNRKRAKEWRLNNLDAYRANQRRWRSENREKIAAYIAEWIENNPGRYKESRQASNTRRRTRKKENGGTCTAKDIRALFKKSKGCCAGCGAKAKNLEIDHIMPIAKGGSSDPSNLQLLCCHCNRTKHSKHPIDWARENGRLL